MKTQKYGFDGLPTLEGRFRRDIPVELRPDGVAYWPKPGGQACFIPTRQRPGPGAKVDALTSLDTILAGPLVGQVRPGGKAFTTAMTMATLLHGSPVYVEIHLLNSGEPCPVLVDALTRAGIRCRSFQRQRTPCNLEIPMRLDRLLIRGSIGIAPANLDGDHATIVREGLNGATAHACVSANDAALCSAAIGSCNGAYKYLLLTGSLPPGLTLGLLAQADEAAGNLGEWSTVARWARLAIPGIGEKSADAPDAAIHLLRTLRGKGLAAVHAALCTLGSNGAVMLDWDRDRAYHILPELRDGRRLVPAPAFTGDRFLGAWIFLRETWSKQGHLRDPIAANGVRATRYAVHSLGHRDEDCDVCVRRL
jgi:hypothetical protein